MTQLTDEMKAQGWRDISKIETLKNYRDEYDDDERWNEILGIKGFKPEKPSNYFPEINEWNFATFKRIHNK